MSKATVQFTVFTKPWKLPLPELAEHVRGLGFDGVELPVRPGFQVEPENVAKRLPEAARILADQGLRIGSVAGPIDQPTIAACGQAGVKLIRICCHIPAGMAYMAAEADWRRQFDAVIDALDAHGVTIGVQNHCGRQVSGAMGLRSLIDGHDPRHVAAVLDFGHCGLAGEPVDLAIDALEGRMALVNFKNAFWRRTNGPEATQAAWSNYWTTGGHGMADWPAAVAELKRRGYAGDVCLTAEYSDRDNVDAYTGEDLAYLKALWNV